MKSAHAHSFVRALPSRITNVWKQRKANTILLTSKFIGYVSIRHLEEAYICDLYLKCAS